MKLTPSVIDKLADSMKHGATIDVACNIAEVHRSSFFRWKKAAEQLHDDLDKEKIKKSDFTTRQSHLMEFLKEVLFAVSRYELDLLKEIREGKRGWQAKAWILERRFRERYARRVMVDTELFVKHFEREHGSELTVVLQSVLDTAEAIAASNQTYDEPDMQGKKLQLAAGQGAKDDETQNSD